ncbi:hypothetical protein Tco_1053721 [Tanacetum coccineum]|uniref:Uncharacterized protein n=1 Tax=Tanacetum coccineum TaxID=301880 RepID=A0ABQ5GVR4_9ASTR
MVTVPIHQASSTTPTLSTPIIDSNSQPYLSIQETIFTTTTIITLLPPPPPLQQQSTIDLELANRNHNLYSKIDNYINKTVKEAVQNALQAPVCERFRELLEFEMKEILHDRMFEIGSYRSQPEHAALYEALEASMDRDNREEFIEATTKSRKRHHDDQEISSLLIKRLGPKTRRKVMTLMSLLRN